MGNSQKNICILNVFGATNRGDGAIFVSLVKLVKESFARRRQRVTIAALARYSEGMDWSEQLHDVKFYEPLFASYYQSRWMRRLFSLYIISVIGIWLIGLRRLAVTLLPERKRRALRAIEASDHVLSCGGAFLDDSSPSFLLNLLEIKVATSLQKQVVLVSQSIGPFRSGWSRYVASRILRDVTYVLPRETWTERYVVEQLHIDKQRVRLVPDLAFDSPAVSKEQACKVLQGYGINTDHKLVGITVLPWVYPGTENPILMHKKYVDAMARLCDYVSEKYQVEIIFVPQYVKGPENSTDDMDIAGEVFASATHTANLHLLSRDFTPDFVKGMIGCMDVFVGTRMHSNIFALSQAVPAMAISYLPKTTYIMESLQLSEYVLDISNIEPQTLQNTFDAVWNNRVELTRHLRTVIPPYQSRIKDTLDILFESATSGC